LSESQMIRVNASGFLGGFWNKFREENGRWWGTRKWLIQCAIWLLLINGIIALSVRQGSASPQLPALLGLFSGLMGWMAAFGVIILTQGEIVEERASGTAEWVLSAPLSREAFIVSKFLVNSLWLLGIIVVLQGIVFNFMLTAFGLQMVPWADLLMGLALQGLHLVFWLSLLLMLGAFFRGRNPVIGVPLIFLFVQRLIPETLGSIGASIQLVLPMSLTDYSGILLAGGALPSYTPVVAVAVASIAFVVLAIWRFKREEF
jgi:ABC-type transport system involved in multi-copper enzyme maturation permease subunit